MRLIQIIRLRLRSLFSRNSAEQELAEELTYHLEREIQNNIEAGMTPEQARYAARRAMGALEQSKEQCRDSRQTNWLHDLLQDLAYSARTLCKTPGFTLIATLVLALAIGANTAVFTVVNAVLLRPLPYPQPDRLFLLSSVPKILNFDPGPIMVDRDYLEFRRHNHSFESLAMVSVGAREITLTRHGEPAILKASQVDSDFLHVLRTYPVLGHTFLPETRSALLSNALWKTRFNADPNIPGKTIYLDGTLCTIAGVMPAAFTFQQADVWISEKIRLNAQNVFFRPVIGRLKPGVTPQQAQAELATFTAALPPNQEFDPHGYTTRLLPLKDLFVASLRKLLLIFSGAVAFVFLIACANFANLLLIRGATRQPELAVRAALGASRWRLIRQLTTESTLLSLLGAAFGILLSFLGVRALIALLPPGTEVHTDIRVLFFAIGLALVTGLIFGLAPALQATRRELREGVTEGGRNVLVRRERLRGALVIAEIALALILLAGAGLLVKSFLQLRAVNPGFRAANLTVATVDLPKARYQTAAQMQQFDAQVLSALSSLPGVQSSAAVSFLPFGYGVMGRFQPDTGITVDKPAISPGYFRTMGIRIITGRAFTDHDDAAAIISESLARHLWPNGEAVGKRIFMDDRWLTIVGIAADVRQTGLTDKASAIIYQPYLQINQPGFLDHISFVVQSNTPAAASLRSIIRRLDSDLPVQSITTMDSIVAASLSDTRSQTRLLAIFSILALLLAAIGIYGVLAFSVAQRTHEIGIRMALGADTPDILWMVLGRTLALTGTGLLIGLPGALALTRILKKFLFEVTPADPLTYSAVISILITVALLAACIPARRAARVHPATALHYD